MKDIDTLIAPHYTALSRHAASAAIAAEALR